MITRRFYTNQIQTATGIIEETKTLLDLWKLGMSTPELFNIALQSGNFPNVSASRLRNIITSGFAPRYLNADGCPAGVLKRLLPGMSASELTQLFFIYTCRANTLLVDFIRKVYWEHYISGRGIVSNEEAKEFVIKANQEGKMLRPWSESTIRRVATNLTRTCADFGLLEDGKLKVRKIKTFRIELKVAIYLAYDLHFLGHGDNFIISHSDWALFGMEPQDVIDIMKQLSLRGFIIIQTAADVTCISWKYKEWEELIHAISQG